jgi:DNA-binding MarR family transcriptional regulator
MLYNFVARHPGATLADLYPVLKIERRIIKDYVFYLIEFGYLKENVKGRIIHYEATVPPKSTPIMKNIYAPVREVSKGEDIKDTILDFIWLDPDKTEEYISLYAGFYIDDVRKAIDKLKSMNLIVENKEKSSIVYSLNVDGFNKYRNVPPYPPAYVKWRERLKAEKEAAKTEKAVPLKAESAEEPKSRLMKPPKKAKEGMSLPSRLKIHLLRYDKERYETTVDPAVTQKGICDALGVEQNTLTIAIKRQVINGFIKEDQRHVKTRKRRYMCYFLTLEGEREAKRLLKEETKM